MPLGQDTGREATAGPGVGGGGGAGSSTNRKLFGERKNRSCYVINRSRKATDQGHRADGWRAREEPKGVSAPEAGAAHSGVEGRGPGGT